MNVKIKARVHNRFDIEVINARTGEVRQRAKAENVICDGYYTSLFGPTGTFAYIRVGSGSGTPSATDTDLFHTEGSFSMSEGTGFESNDDENWLSYNTKTTITETALVGKVISEVGIGNYYNNALCSHAMLKDMNGNPITIEKTDTDIINIYATRFLHIGTYDGGKILMDKPSKNPELYQCLLGAKDNTVARLALTDNSGICYYTSGYAAGYRKSANFVKSSDGKTLTLTFPRFGAAECNDYHGFGGFYISDGAGYLLAGNCGFAYSQIDGESVGTGDGTKTGFTTYFDVDDSKPMSVYVNGTETADWHYRKTATTDYGAKYLIRISEDSTATNIIPIPGKMDTIVPEQETVYFYNPMYISGLDKVYMQSGRYMAFSNDMETWSEYVGPGSNNYNSVPAEYANYKFIKIISSYGSIAMSWVNSFKTIAAPNIVFDNPPAAGAVVTVDYTPCVIAKDVNHVFDLTVTYHLGEYTPE